MTGLRERQKADRSRRILDVARDRFRKQGYHTVTIDSIAAAADVSSVTVYNYYGVKARLLLALVEESDARLIAKLTALIAHPDGPLSEMVARFGQVLRQHALGYLTKPTWRQVLAASIIDGGDEFGRGYRQLDRVLIEIMTELVRHYQTDGALNPAVNAADLGETLFELQNMRFFHFIADDGLADDAVDARLRRDLAALFAAGAGGGA